MTLTAANTYGGGTIISGGTLIDTYASNATNTNQSGWEAFPLRPPSASMASYALVLAAGNAFSGGVFNSTWTLAINGGLVTSTNLNSNNNLGNIVLTAAPFRQTTGSKAPHPMAMLQYQRQCNRDRHKSYVHPAGGQHDV